MLPWIWAWVIIQILLPHPVGTNPLSRLATMAAICSENRFEISSYVREEVKYDWTVDWAKTPDGRYFSNKAPGAALLGAPIFCVIDRWFYSKGEPEPSTRTPKQYKARWVVTGLASLLLQILPMAFLVFLIDGHLRSTGTSRRARRFITLALLFGHTGSIYMNSWWGHGLSCVLGLASFMTLQSRRFVTFGFMIGLALLNDYSFALLFPGFAYLIGSEKPSLKELMHIAAGGVFPGILWVLYHVNSFGSPFTLPNAFQNPIFVDQGGLFSSLPKLDISLELLFGPDRGLLFTQPWIVFTLILMFIPKYRSLVLTPVTVFILSGFVLLFWMNASFNGWHGGNTVGPRYLSPILPFFAIWLTPVFDELNEVGKKTLEAGLIVAIALFVASYTISIEPPERNLINGFAQAMKTRDFPTLLSRSLIQISALIGAYFWLQKRSSSPS